MATEWITAIDKRWISVDCKYSGDAFLNWDYFVWHTVALVNLLLFITELILAYIDSSAFLASRRLSSLSLRETVNDDITELK